MTDCSRLLHKEKVIAIALTCVSILVLTIPVLTIPVGLGWIKELTELVTLIVAGSFIALASVAGTFWYKTWLKNKSVDHMFDYTESNKNIVKNLRVQGEGEPKIAKLNKSNENIFDGIDVKRLPPEEGGRDDDAQNKTDG